MVVACDSLDQKIMRAGIDLDAVTKTYAALYRSPTIADLHIAQIYVVSSRTQESEPITALENKIFKIQVGFIRHINTVIPL
jgi:hypothetical protein